MRIEGSGTRASSLLDRVERDATPCLLIMLVCGACCRRSATLLGTWRPRRTARGSLLANVWCGSFSCGSGQSTVPESAIRWEFAVPLRLGIDIACRAAHQVSLADEQGRFIWTGRRFRTTPQDLARLWAMLPDGTHPAEVLVVMEPTRNAWVPLAAWFRRRGVGLVLCHRNARRICAATTPSTPSQTGWTPSCWPGCRCCIPTACMPSRSGSNAPPERSIRQG